MIVTAHYSIADRRRTAIASISQAVDFGQTLDEVMDDLTRSARNCDGAAIARWTFSR